MKEERAKPMLKPTEDGTLVHKDDKAKKKKIIGGTGSDTITTESQEQTETNEPKDMFEEAINVNTPTLKPEEITITDDNISKYQFSVKGLENLPGNINI